MRFCARLRERMYAVFLYQDECTGVCVFVPGLGCGGLRFYCPASSVEVCVFVPDFECGGLRLLCLALSSVTVSSPGFECGVAVSVHEFSRSRLQCPALS